MYSSTVLEKDGELYIAVVSFSTKNRTWMGYILKDGEWFAYAGTASTAPEAFSLCESKLYGEDVTTDSANS